MTPFVSEYFLYILLILAIPAVFIGLFGKPIKYYGLIATLAIVLLVYNTHEKLILLGIFYLFSLLTAIIYSKINTKNIFVFWFFCVLMLLPLVISKFVMDANWIHFLGLSYISFRTIQFITGWKEGKIEKVKIFIFTYFILFFPSLSSGPIDRLKRFEQDLTALYSKGEYLECLQEGIWKIFNGLLYSFVLAPVIQIYLITKYDSGGSVAAMIVYAYSYTLYLFFNFAGYSKLAIGTSYIFGIKLPENFAMPFISRDLKEFWSRWHMSLSTFFRDYIYNKFVVVTLKRKWFKNPHIGSYLGYLLTMSVMGLWHGINLHFIIYGIYHGVLMCVNDWMDNNLKGFKKFKNSSAGSVLCTFVTFHVVAFGLLIFSGKLF